MRTVARTHVGLQRGHNEDTFLCDEDLGIFAVIDGVGGEVAGETAANKAAEILLGRLRRKTAAAPQRLREAITLANNAIYDEASRDPLFHGMACVLTAAVLEEDRLTVGHVGDTRLYHLSSGQMVKVTQDHSTVGLMEEEGELSEREAMDHPRRSEILRDVGSERYELTDDGFVAIYELSLAPDEAILLCSDGLTDQVPAAEIQAIVERNAGDPRRTVELLIETANRAGGKDNVTVVLLEGETFADHLRRRWHVPGETRQTALGSSTPPPVRAAYHVPDGLLARLSRRSVRIGLLLAAVAAVLALSLAYVAERSPEVLQRLSPSSWKAPRPWRVGGDAATHDSIGQALAAARPGQVIEIAPGIYDERIELRNGVALVSIEPRGAVLRLGSEGSLDAPVAVLAEGVLDARLEGFRIVGDDEHPLAVGLRLVDSAVQVEDVEVTGADLGAIEIIGTDRSLVAFSSLRANGGAGVLLEGPTATRLRHNLIEGNGAAADPPAAGIEIRNGAGVSLHDNRFADNAGGPIRGAPTDRLREIERRNRFDGGTPVVHAPAAPVTESLPSASAEGAEGAPTQ